MLHHGHFSCAPHIGFILAIRGPEAVPPRYSDVDSCAGGFNTMTTITAAGDFFISR
jgi:hypothetical protein